MNSKIPKPKKLSHVEVRQQLNELVILFMHTSVKKRASKTKNKDSMQELLDFLRICIKDKLLDAEAYKRELEILQKEIEALKKKEKDRDKDK